LWRIISLLRPRELLVLLLHDLEHMSFNEIGPILRRSDDAVRKLRERALVHCRHQARLLVDQEGFEQILGRPCEIIREDEP
jgi:DNA-directed RNA polymerase specialized sigma24 family protein